MCCVCVQLQLQTGVQRIHLQHSLTVQSVFHVEGWYGNYRHSHKANEQWCTAWSRGTWGDVRSLSKTARSHGRGLHSTIMSALLIRVVLSAFSSVTHNLPNSARPNPLMAPFPILPIYSLTLFLCLSHTRSMPSSYGNLWAQETGQAVNTQIPSSLCAHFPWLTLHGNKNTTRGSHHQRLPPPAHSDVSHLVWSCRLWCKSTVFLTSPASHTLPNKNSSKGGLVMLDDCFFYSLQPFYIPTVYFSA